MPNYMKCRAAGISRGGVGKVKVSEHLKISKRAIGVLLKLNRTYFICETLSSVLNGVRPYISIYYSAKLIDALYEGESLNVLLGYIGLTVGLTFLLSLSAQGLAAIAKRGFAVAYREEQWMYADKAMQMSYESIEDSAVKLLQERCKQERRIGFQMPKSLSAIREVAKGITSIAASVGLSVGFFRLAAVPLLWKLLLVLGMLVSVVYTAWSASVIDFLHREFFAGYGWLNIFFDKYISADYMVGKEIRLYGMSDMIAQNIAESWKQQNKCEYNLNVKRILLNIPKTILNAVLKYGIYVILLMAVMKGEVSVGSIAKYVSCIMLLMNTCFELVKVGSGVLENHHYWKRYFSYLDIPNEMYQGTLTVEKRDDNEYFVEFKDVSFKYPNTDFYALRHVNLKFKIGEKLAVVGMNGSGKTTFIKLMCRLYDPTEGRILLNGVDIRKYDYDEYMSVFSIVFQDFKLLDFSLGQNVAAAKVYDEERVKACLQQAGFGESFKKMPSGTETYLYKGFHKNGVEISGGEAQKIALARALYKDAPFMILDEPTAALDPISEYEIYVKFNEIVQDKTTINISHRLASCRFCDKIAVFDEGQIVQIGSHHSLLADQSGKYYELWNAQAQYYA